MANSVVNTLDIDLLPLYRRAGQDQSNLPGLLVASRPRRLARSREADQLIIYLSLLGNATLPLDLPDQLLGEMVKTYYDTNGSVTSALRSTAELVNQLLLKRNLQSSGSGQQVIGLLSLATLRGDDFYLAQSGPVYALYLGSGGTQEQYDPALSGRGLGANQSVPLRYFHASLQAGDTLLLAVRPPANWNAQSLSSLYGRDFGYQQRLLLDQLNDLNAVLLNARSGAGRVSVLSGRPVSPPERSAPGALAPAAGMAAAQGLGEDIAAETIEDLVRTQAMLDQYQPLPELENLAAAPALTSEAISVSSARPGSPAQTAQAAPPQTQTETAAAPRSAPKPAKTETGIFRRMGRALSIGLGRLLPEDTLAAIPNSVMAFMALAIPLIVVAMATAVYFQRGLAAQAEMAYTQAVESVAQAQVQVDPQARRSGMNSALDYLEAADTYRKLPQTQTLRQQIFLELDTLDLVRRVNYQPAIIGGLPSDTAISRMVVVDSDLYLLDGQNGKVLRAFFTNQGYQLDTGFQCGPGSPANAGPLVDLAVWPFGSSPSANVVAMDAKGMLLFCAPGEAPLPKKLPRPPTGELDNLATFALDQNNLYVLDPGLNAVWVYYNGDFEGEPASYFGEQAPPPLQSVIDLAASNDDLYLLYEDGHMAICVTGGLGDTIPNRCTDPAPYMDMRVGSESLPLTPAPGYAQMQNSPPPDPSLYLLIPDEQTIHRYSLRSLAYQGGYAPLQPLGKEATAAVVDPAERLIFLAAGEQIYYAILP